MASRWSTLSEVNVADLTEQFGSSLCIEDEWIQIPRRAFSSSDEDDVVAIPRHRDSLATLRFLGLSKKAANNTWERYRASFLYDVDDDIIRSAKGTVRGGKDTDSINDTEWTVAMRTMGVSKDLRTRIMTPAHQSIRLLKTPMAWVLQTMKERWADLENINTYIYILAREKEKGASKFVTLEARQDNKEKGVEGKDSSSRSIDDEAGDRKHLTVGTVVEERTARADEMHLYKGGSYARFLDAFQVEEFPGLRFKTSRLASHPPTDFSQSPGSTYWTKHLELAEEFASYAKTRGADTNSTGILHMIVSKTMIESAVQFKETAHWQEFVFWNLIRGPIPGHLAYLVRAEVLSGSMACESRDQILRRRSKGGKFTTMQPYKLGSGTKAMQVSFYGEEIHDRLDVEAKLWLEEWVELPALQKKGAE